MTSTDTARRVTWTLAIRKPRANRFRRVDGLALSWEGAHQLARQVGARHPELEIWYTTTAAYETRRAAELVAEVAAGTTSQDYADSIIEDHGNLLVDTGRRVRIVEGGALPADCAELVADVEAAHAEALAEGDERRFDAAVAAARAVDTMARQLAEQVTESRQMRDTLRAEGFEVMGKRNSELRAMFADTELRARRRAEVAAPEGVVSISYYGDDEITHVATLTDPLMAARLLADVERFDNLHLVEVVAPPTFEAYRANLRRN